MIKSNVENGERVTLNLGEFVGLAGFVQRDPNEARLAYMPNRATDRPTDVGDELDLADAHWRVALRERSPYVENMTLLTLYRLGPSTIEQGAVG